MPALMVSDEPWLSRPAPQPTFTATVMTGPGRVQVASSTGATAVFTIGARTVAISGLPSRTFRETKRVGSKYRDTFDRTTTSRLGMSPFTGKWSDPIGGTNSDYTCDGSSALIVVSTNNISRYTTLLDNDVRDYDVRLSVTTTTMPAGAGNSTALVGSYVDTNNLWRARLVFNTTGTVQVAIDKLLAGTTTTPGALTQVGTGYTPGQVWWIRMRNVAGVVQAKAWLDGAAEPGGWTVTVNDPDLSTGRVGIRALTSTGATNIPQTFVYGQFEITEGAWANPPTVTHNTWVRLLPTPFATFSSTVEGWLRAALTDTTPDILATAMAFITGGAAVLDPSLGAGKQVLGEAMYGPLNPDGTKVEGADWNDYIRITGVYPGGVTDINEATQQFCFDCSGFVRIVYGYWGRIPMTLQDPAQYDGTNLPRRAVAIGPSGPGVLIAGDGSTVPPLDSLQIGDVPTFNADLLDDDATTQTDDHIGIYLGQDGAGNHRFISSRKTANGPSFADLGGNAYLNGTGTYATALRRIRRF